jgi:hypothetical protein
MRTHMPAHTSIIAQTVEAQRNKNFFGAVIWSEVKVKSPFAPRKGVLLRSGNSPAFDRRGTRRRAGSACAGCPDKETPRASTPANRNWNLVLNHAGYAGSRGPSSRSSTTFRTTRWPRPDNLGLGSFRLWSAAVAGDDAVAFHRCPSTSMRTHMLSRTSIIAQRVEAQRNKIFFAAVMLVDYAGSRNQSSRSSTTFRTTRWPLPDRRDSPRIKTGELNHALHPKGRVQSVVQFLRNGNSRHRVGFSGSILINHSEDAPLSTTSYPKNIRALMGTRGFVARFLEARALHEPGDRRAA